MLLNNLVVPGTVWGMTWLRSTLLALSFSIVAQAAQAGCYADYKAKRDNPLRLHYGVAELGGECTLTAAKQELSGRLASGGWVLLTVISVFSEDQLGEKRDDAGPYYLRF